MPNFIDEYLIRLGTSVDSAGIARFQTALREASSMVDASAFGMTKSMFKAQTEIVGGFAAIGGAAIGLADKVAMADQEYRLFALHMYMSKDAARSLKVAMDALGQPLENLSWDTELRERTRQLIADQRAMAPGGDFEDGMRKIRDIRFEFTRMEVELQYLGMHFVQDFMKSLGVGPDEFLTKLRRFNEWVIVNMPAISHALAAEFLPIWHDIEHVIVATGKAIEEAGVLFTNLVGLFSGDSSIEGTTLNLDKMLTAVQHVGSGFAEFATLIAHTEMLLAHFVNALVLLSERKFKEAGAELKASGDSITTKEGMELLGGGFGFLTAGPWGALAGAGAMHQFGNTLENSIGSPTGGKSLHDLITSTASGLGIDPALAHALAMQESGENQSAVSKTGAVGVMQLMDGTARGLGVNRYDTVQNIVGGLTLFAHLLKQYGSIPNAIAAYHEGESKMNHILSGRATMSNEGRNEVASVLARYRQSGVTINGGVTIHVQQQPSENGAALAQRLVEHLRTSQDKQTQRNLLEFQSLGTSY